MTNDENNAQWLAALFACWAHGGRITRQIWSALASEPKWMALDVVEQSRVLALLDWEIQHQEMDALNCLLAQGMATTATVRDELGIRLAMDESRQEALLAKRERLVEIGRPHLGESLDELVALLGEK